MACIDLKSPMRSKKLPSILNPLFQVSKNSSSGLCETTTDNAKVSCWFTFSTSTTSLHVIVSGMTLHIMRVSISAGECKINK